MAPLVNRVIAYFDLQSHRRGHPVGFAGKGPNLSVIPQYVALVLGIIAQPFLAAFQTTGAWTVTFEALFNWTIFAAVVGIIVFPGVYLKAFDPGQPKFVQFCAIFATGIGWKALFASVMKAAGV